MVLAYDSQSAQHTVKWENGPGGRTGVTATNLDDGIVTWVKGPDGAGGGRQPFSKPHGPTRETRPTPSSEKKKKQKTNDPGSDSKQKKQKKPPVNRPKSAETLEEVEKRIGSGTIKGICFQVLKDAGPTGLLLSEIVHQTQTRGLKDWSSVNQPSNTVNACCSGDPAFVKVAPGRVGLACLGAVESPDLAAQEEREHGEKVLYCDACRGGPFNTKGMRMHISRWCAFAKGNARGGEGRPLQFPLSLLFARLGLSVCSVPCNSLPLPMLRVVRCFKVDVHECSFDFRHLLDRVLEGFADVVCLSQWHVFRKHDIHFYEVLRAEGVRPYGVNTHDLGVVVPGEVRELG